MSGRAVGQRWSRFSAVVALCAGLVLALPLAGAATDPARWRADLGRTRQLAENDAPAAHAQARRLLAELGEGAAASDRALVLNLLARIESYRAEPVQADAHARQALELALLAADRASQAEAHLNIALNAVNLADMNAMAQATQQAVAALDGVDRPDLLGEALLRLVSMHRRFGQFDLSVTTAMQALQIARRSADPRALAFAHHGMAIAFNQTNRDQERQAELRQMLVQARRAQSAVLAAEATLGLGNELASQGDGAEAERLIREAVALFRAAGLRYGAARATFCLGDFYRRDGRHAEAQRLLEEALALYRELHPNKIGEWWVLESMSHNAQAQGDLAAAWLHAQQGHGLAADIGLELYLHDSLMRMAAVVAARGEHKRAYELSLQAIESSAKAARERAGVRMADLATRYEAESRQRETKELRQRAERQAVEHRWLWTLITTITASLIVMAALLLRQRRSNRLLSQANEKLQQSENELRAVLDAVPDLLFEMGPDGEYLDVHCSRPEMLAAPVDQLIGRRVADVLPAESAQACLQTLAEAAERGRSSGREYALDLPAGRAWFEMWAARRSMGDQAPRFVLLVRDVTVRRRIQAKEVARLQILEGMARGVALDETLAAVVSYVEDALPDVGACILLSDGGQQPVRVMAGPVLGPLLRCAFEGARADPEGAAEMLCELAGTEGLHLCGSVPILAADGGRLGVFGLFDNRSSRPIQVCEEGLDLVRRAGQLAAIAIHRHRIEDALRAGERRYRDVFDNVSDSLALLEVTNQGELKVLEVNPTFERTTGLSRSRVLGREVQQVLPPAAAQKVRRYCGLCIHSGRSLEEDIVYELPDGRRIFHTTLIPVRGGAGGVVRIVGIGRDVTLREQHAALNRRLQHFAELAPGFAFVYRMDAGGVQSFVYAGPGVEEVLGLAAGTLLADASAFFECALPQERGRVTRVLAEAAASGRACVLEYRIDHPQRGEAWVELRSQPEREADGALAWHGYVNDISERKASERRLQESLGLLRALTSQRETAREEERKRIAREVHDELGQMLSAMRLDLSVLRLAHEQRRTDLSGRIGNLLETVDATIKVVRNVATSLRPAALDMGLIPALEWLTSEFSRYSGIPCSLKLVEGGRALDDGEAVGLFRIAQEALTNVARHAQARSAEVRLEPVGGDYVLQVSDDGKGFDPDAPRLRSFGLMGMRERGAAFGGTVVVTARPGLGTLVKATLPLTLAQPSLTALTS